MNEQGGIAITIYDIADLAGVSPSTVSRALNGKPGVSKKNRERIRRVLDENHYIPDEAARSLGMQRTRMVGIVTDDLNSRFQNEAMARSQNELIQKGYQCFSRCVSGEPGGMEKAIAELRNKRVEGVLLFGLSFLDHEKLEKVIARWLPDVPVFLVYQNERFDRDNVYCVGSDEKKGFRTCVEQMVERGRKNLVMVVEKNRASRLKIQTYFETAAKEFGLNYWIYSDVEPTHERGREIAERILREHPDTDGIICTHERLAIEVMYALMEKGKKIPEDISLIGEGNTELCEVCRPRLTVLDTMVIVSTMMSVRMLVDVMEGCAQTHKITLEMELVHRETL